MGVINSKSTTGNRQCNKNNDNNRRRRSSSAAAVVVARLMETIITVINVVTAKIRVAVTVSLTV